MGHFSLTMYFRTFTVITSLLLVWFWSFLRTFVSYESNPHGWVHFIISGSACSMWPLLLGLTSPIPNQAYNSANPRLPFGELSIRFVLTLVSVWHITVFPAHTAIPEIKPQLWLPSQLLIPQGWENPYLFLRIKDFSLSLVLFLVPFLYRQTPWNSIIFLDLE